MTATLYERLGGGKGIRTIVNDVVDFHLRNPLIQNRFLKTDPDDLKRLATEFFAAGSGGPESYTGRDMRSAHEGMNISEQEFLAVLDDTMAALDKNGVGAAEKGEVLSILYSMKDEIIRG